ncbi:MAG: hypothetical protein ACLFNN_01805 [Candidatus Paceibacterota bacterium]
MSYEIPPEEIERLLGLEGEVRGVVFKTDHHYLKDKAGEEGVKKAEEEMKKMGYPFSYERDATDLNFHPIGVRSLSLIAVSRVLDLDKEGVKEMGRTAPKFSSVLRFFMRYLISERTIMEKAGELWQKHYTVGELKVLEINHEERFLKCALYDIDLHPIFCDYLAAYLEFIAKLGIGEEMESEETMCIHRGDDHHEFIEKW